MTLQNSTSTGKQLLMGLHDSGKSTFLGALWHVVESGEIPDALNLHSLGTDREYIESVRAAWLSGKKPERNSITDRHFVSMQLLQVNTNAIAEIIFPDLAGELFEEQWRDRVWTQDFANL